MSEAPPIAAVASSFQAGLLCPACQGRILTGERIVTCGACSTAHHEPCWTRLSRCVSYHCDTRTQAEPAARAEIVVTGSEAANVVIPPPRVPATTADVALRNLAPAKTRWSPAAFAILALATLTLCVSGAAALAGDVTGTGQVLPLVSLGGLVASFAIGVAGAVIAASVRSSRTDKGTAFALLAILFAIGTAVLFLVALVRLAPVPHHAAPFELADPEPPAPESFERAPAPIANAMRANVFVGGREQAGLMGRAWCGAGIILGQRSGFTYILTNRHVVDPSGGGGGGRELSVTFANSEVARAEVEWTAPEGIDLGVLRCRALRPPRTTARIRTTPLQVSEKVFAIGNPHRLSWTYTEGAVSRVHPTHTASGAPLEIVQTQTPIMPGNSGGGLYDALGRLCGVNTWVVDPNAGGPGLSISAKTVLEVLPDAYKKLVDESEDAAKEGGR